jgi:ABC-type polysaccharide/polyol phosphate export permease
VIVNLIFESEIIKTPFFLKIFTGFFYNFPNQIGAQIQLNPLNYFINFIRNIFWWYNWPTRFHIYKNKHRVSSC